MNEQTKSKKTSKAEVIYNDILHQNELYDSCMLET